VTATPDPCSGTILSKSEDPAMPRTASLLALVGVAGFALLSLLFGILT